VVMVPKLGKQRQKHARNRRQSVAHLRALWLPLAKGRPVRITISSRPVVMAV